MSRLAEVKKFLEEVKIETKKVTYPSREDTIATTWVVIALVVFIGFYLGVVDWLLSLLSSYIL